MTFTAVGSSSGNGAGSFSLTPHAVGNIIVLEVNWSTSVTTGASSSNATWTVIAGPTVTGARTSIVILGVVTSTSTATVTLATSGSPVFAWQEFSTTAGAANVLLDAVGTVNAAGTAYPSITPGHGSGELYFGFAFNGVAASAGSTSGYTYNANVDGNSDGLCFNPACTSATQTPTWADSNTKSGIAVLLYEAGTTVASPRPAARGRAAAARRGKGTVQAGTYSPPAAPVPQPPFPVTANRARRPYWPRRGTGAAQGGAPVTPAIPQPPFPGRPSTARRPFWVRRGSGQVLAGAPFTRHPVVVGTWTGSYAVPSGFFFPSPSAAPLQVPIMNTPGDWVFALAAWRPSVTGADVSVCVADDAHNYWDPVGMPSADSGAAGAVRTAVWAAPAARVANSVTGVTQVQVAPTGPVLSLAVTIIDMSGILPWFTVAAITGNYGNAVSSLALSAGAPAASAVLFAAFGSDNNSDTVTGPAGWTALTGASATNGVDHTADIKLTPAWQVTSSSSSASVSSSGSLDLAGVIAGILVNAPAPSQPNPSWTVMITEAAVGAGVQTVPSELTWTDISARSLSLSIKQGKQYSQGALSAGQGVISLDSPDGATIPPGSGIFAGIDSGMPLRRRIIIPQLASPHYVSFSGYYRRSPWAMDPALYRGKATAEITDAWGYASGPLNSMAIEEILLDQPHALYPCTDPAGAGAASNLSPGNSLPLTQAVSKYGTGGATADFGAGSGQLIGASSAQATSSGQSGGGTGMWSQALAGQSLAFNGYGYALQVTDPGFPAISGAVTVETWAGCTLNADLGPLNGNSVFVATASVSPAFAVGSNAFPDGMPVVLSVAAGFTFPSPFTAGTVYYVVNAAGNGGNFDLAATQGGAAIACTVSGDGFIGCQLAWDPVIMSLRDGKGTVFGLSIRNTDGALLLLHRNGTSVTATVADSGRDYRTGSAHFSLAVTQTTWRLFVNAGETLTATGSFSPALPATFREACFGGVQDATSQGYALPGTIAFPVIIPGFSPQARVVTRFQALYFGQAGEGANDRVERLLEYAGLAGRRWIGDQVPAGPGEGDLVASGQDIGGQPASGSAGNIAQSTLPAQLYVAPTGDITYLSKFYTWNQPVRWVLGDNTAGGEIPFLPGQMSTDYDPTRVSSPVQLTSLDSQAVTVPSGATSSTTMAAVTAASGKQYGGQPYQSTSYLNLDSSSAYTAGGSSVDLANWIANIYSRPQNRVQAVTVEAAANAANLSSQQAWAFFAGASAGDMVQVNVRPPTAVTSPLISLIARVTQTDRSSQFSLDGTSAKITVTLDFAPEYNCLTCDDPVRGRLDGSTVLGW